MSEALVDRWRATLLRQLVHDIRTPLSGVLGLAELVALTATDDETRRYGTLIHESGSRLQLMLEGVLDLARASAEVPPDPNSCDLRRILDSVAACHAAAAQRRGAAIRVECDPALASRLRTDRPRLVFVAHAMVRDTVTRAAAGAVVRVQARLEPDRVAIATAIEGAAPGGDADREWKRPCAVLLAKVGGAFAPAVAGRCEFWVPLQPPGSLEGPGVFA